MHNRLSRESSPYLLAHANDPVDWHTWNEEALARAKSEKKPIHLSIGYSACHWCWVLHKESFTHPATAAILNERFINIKVDREERPDLDRIYQLAHQALTQRPGGWPLTMFLTHDDHRPFFGGTYFPDKPRHGLPAFSELLKRVAEYYQQHQDELRQQNTELMQLFNELNPPPAADDVALDQGPLTACREQLQTSFDAQFGGFGRAPKFPHANQIERLLRDWHATTEAAEPDLQALYMATLSLRRMAEGGLRDQLGGGFYRYSVDPYWMIPHFEKMLYDNGTLLAVYAQAAVATGDAFYAQIAASTAEWAIRETQAPQGGYYSSFNADSEGHEGKFYVWDREEVRRALTPEEYSVFAPRFGLDREANFEGLWHLHTFRSLEAISSEQGARDSAKAPSEVEALLASAQKKLFLIRNKRIWPSRDDKILTSWNALMIRGMAQAARALERADLAESATRALTFLRKTHWRDGRLQAASKEGRAYLNAYLDDYVFLVDAVLELQQVRFEAQELSFARELLEVMLAHFEDQEAGGFYFTADDHEALIHRSKSFSDDATPAGNGIAAFVLQRMGYLLGEPRYLAAAERTLRAAWQAIGKYPQAHTSLLLALEEYLQAPESLILRGPAVELEAARRELAKAYTPRRLVLAIASDVSDLPSALADKAPRGDQVVAYLCRGSTCETAWTK